MNINNLKKGQVFNNKKQLCKELGVIPANGGRNIKLQEKEFNRYFTFHKEGRKIIIDTIYTEVKEKEDNRGKNKNSRNNNVYAKYIDYILLNYFKDKTKDRYYTRLTTKEIAGIVNVININYKVASNNKQKTRCYLKNNNVAAVLDTFSKIQSIINSSINASLKRLEQRKWIKYKKTYMILEDKIIEDTKMENYRVAEYREVELIEKTKKEVLEQMQITNKELHRSDKLRNKYYINLDKKLEQFNINKCWEIYNVNIDEDIEEINIDKNKVLEYKQTLNKLIKEKVIEYAERNIKKENKSNFAKNRLKENYILAVKELLELVVNSNAKDVRYDIEKQIEDNFTHYLFKEYKQEEEERKGRKDMEKYCKEHNTTEDALFIKILNGEI